MRAALDGERFAAAFGRRLAEAVGERYGRVVCAGGAAWWRWCVHNLAVAFLRIEPRVRTNALNSTGGHLRRDGVRFEFRATKAGVAGGKCTTMVARTGEPASSQMAVQAISLYPLEKEICQHRISGLSI